MGAAKEEDGIKKFQMADGIKVGGPLKVLLMVAQENLLDKRNYPSLTRSRLSISIEGRTCGTPLHLRFRFTRKLYGLKPNKLKIAN